MSSADECTAFDPFDAVMRDDAPGQFAALAHEKCPVAHVRSDFDFHVISDPAYIADVMFKDTSIWTVELSPPAAPARDREPDGARR